ncbi:TonB-dependent receptor [Cytophagaceae bacterium ABcell3]|nr:TonB-dependent receptor [Cytophagaceae bacterium ABcell3]
MSIYIKQKLKDTSKWPVVFLSILLLSISGLSAQEKVDCVHSLSGQISDGETGLPLAYAEVILENAVIESAYTDDNGTYEFKKLCPGTTYLVKVSFLGYKPIEVSVTIDDDQERNFILHEEVCELPSVVVEGSKAPNIEPLPEVSLSGKELRETRGKSLGEAVSRIPGVYAMQTGPTIFKPVVQGLHSNRILILNNGVRQEGQQWGYEHAPEIDPYVASRITVIKGANSVRYGSDAIGGVILVEPPPLRKEPGVSGEVNLAGFSNNRMGAASATLDFAPAFIKGLSGRVQGTIRNAGNVRAPDYYIDNTGLREYSYSWAAEYQKKRFGVEAYYSRYKTTLGVYRGAHIGNLTDLNHAIASDVPLVTAGFTREIQRPYQDIDHELFKASAWVNTFAGKLLFDYGRQFNDRSEFDTHILSLGPEVPQLRFKITTHTSNLVLEHKPLGRIKGQIGFSGIAQENTWRGSFFIPNFKSYAGGLFIIERWKSKRLELEAGARYDMKTMTVFLREREDIVTDDFLFGNFSGNIGAIYRLSANWKLRGNFGTAFRPPAVNELYSDGVHHGTASYEIGDKNLRPEMAYNATVSAKFAYERVYGEVSVFNNFMHNFIYLSPSERPTVTIRGAFPTFHYRQVNAMFTGTDIAINDSIGSNFVVSSRFSFVRGYNLTEDDYLIWIPPVRWENGIRYWFKTGLGWLRNSYAEVRHVAVARQFMAPEDGDYAPPPPGYMLVNLDIGGTVVLGNTPTEVSLGVYNLFNTSYRDYMDRFRYYVDAMGRNVMLRVRVPLNF